MDNNRKTRPFGIRDSIAYAAGDLGCNMSFALDFLDTVYGNGFVVCPSSGYRTGLGCHKRSVDRLDNRLGQAFL